ncbi:hypothetical protein WG795_RS23170, partial [Escherichia coli]
NYEQKHKRNLKNKYSLLTRSPLRTGIIHQQASTLITLPTSQQIAMMFGLMFSVFPLATSDPGRLCFMCHMLPFTLPYLN